MTNTSDTPSEPATNDTDATTDTSESAHHPPVAAYSDAELQVIIDDQRGRYGVDDPEAAAKQRIRSRKGRGPDCEECGMKPAGLRTFSKHTRSDWGRRTWYRCLRCGTEQLRARRRFCTDE